MTRAGREGLSPENPFEIAFFYDAPSCCSGGRGDTPPLRKLSPDNPLTIAYMRNGVYWWQRRKDEDAP